MTLSLRQRILLTLTPLLLLLALLGGAGTVLLLYLGNRIDDILRENYVSVRAMEQLNEALERIDSSFQFALDGREEEAKKQFDDNWQLYDEQLKVEGENITILPEEQILFDELKKWTADYRDRGRRFYERLAGDRRRHDDYFGTKDDPEGLYPTFKQIKRVSGRILYINQKNMEDANSNAQFTAKASLFGFVAGLVLTAVLAAWFSRQLVRSILRPIGAVTSAAQAIGAGQLNRTVPVIGSDELAQLAHTFNLMTQHLRDFRASNLQRLWRSQQTGQATIDSFPDPILVIDLECQVELANPAARQVFGVVSESDSKPAPWQPPPTLRQPVADALRGEKAYLTETFDQAVSFRLNNEEHTFLPQVRPIRDSHGGILGAAVVLNDVTRFRLLDQIKSNLVATVSHELKTPLTSIRLAVHLLLEETVGPLEPKQVELLLDARDNAERLLNQIEQLLAMARLEDGREAIHLRPETPASLLRRAADEAAVRAEDRHITLTVAPVDHLPPVAADAAQIGHALNNLIDNALAHTDSGGTVALTAEQVDSAVRLTVADTGRGIPPEHLPHLFEKFFRVPDGQPAGTGLGLAIVKQIVNAHGGTIVCESALGRGTTFRLTLPLWKENGHAAAV
jgi:two-component system, NtrC family, sensor histidine kinase KinB